MGNRTQNVQGAARQLWPMQHPRSNAVVITKVSGCRSTQSPSPGKEVDIQGERERKKETGAHTHIHTQTHM